MSIYSLNMIGCCFVALYLQLTIVNAFVRIHQGEISPKNILYKLRYEISINKLNKTSHRLNVIIRLQVNCIFLLLISSGI